MPRIRMRKREPAAAPRRPRRWRAQRTRFRINIHGDGFQEVDLQAAVPTPAPDLNSAAKSRPPSRRVYAH